ncbi:MAG: FAD-dependent oxidoreductase [Acidobacteria bacterium]|nr:FAD-dependent oxidoreductase [Acidobacteriota bacterium]
MNEKVLIIGGNAAGLTAASRAKRIDPRLDVAVLEKGPDISYSTCGIPYFLAKMVTAGDLISYTPESFEKERGIQVHNHTCVDEIAPSRKRVMGARTDTGERVEFSYERLLIATGVRAKPPDIPGTDLANVFTIVDLQDAIRINDALPKAERVAVVGAGYVGLEIAECLHALGKKVHLLEREPHVLPGIDPDMAQIIEYELQRFGVRVTVGAKVLALTGHEGRVSGIKAAAGLGIDPADIVLLDTGVSPNIELARDAGIDIGVTGAIAVNGYMETNVPGIFAAGNCAETYCAIRRRPVRHYIGTVAAKQGRVAGENMAARRTKFLGAIGTTVLKVFDLVVARTGLCSADAAAESIPAVSARIEALDRAAYYPGARKIWIKLIAERESRKLIGAQAAGYGDASKRIDVAASAITAGMRVDELAQLDLAYSPPYGSLWDPLLVAAQTLLRRMSA